MIRVVHPGSRIPDPDADFLLRIRNTVKKHMDQMTQGEIFVSDPGVRSSDVNDNRYYTTGILKEPWGKLLEA
jgi:hypothetical protein